MRLTADHIIDRLRVEGRWSPDRAKIESAVVQIDQAAVEAEVARGIRWVKWDRASPIRTPKSPRSGVPASHFLKRRDTPAEGEIYLVEEEVEIKAIIVFGALPEETLAHENIVPNSNILIPAGNTDDEPYEPGSDYRIDYADGLLRRLPGGRIPKGLQQRLTYRVWLTTCYQPHPPWVQGIRPMRPEHVHMWAELQRWQHIEERAEARVLERVLQAVGVNQENLNVQRGGGG